MRFKITIAIAAVAIVAASMPVFAETLATATTPLNIRSGPGPQYSIIGAIPTRAHTTIIRCIQGSSWCQVSYNGLRGWTDAQYSVSPIYLNGEVVEGAALPESVALTHVSGFDYNYAVLHSPHLP